MGADSDHPFITDETAAAVGKASEALEWVERARGHLYDFHQLMGRADLLFGDAAEQLEQIGLSDSARQLMDDVVGRNVLGGRWTFQIVEEFDKLYWSVASSHVRELEQRHAGGLRHVHESRMKDRRVTPNVAEHARRPPAAASDAADIGSVR